LEEAAKKIVNEKQNFQRIILTKEEALKLFAYNPFKVQLVASKIPDGGKVTAYRNGDLIDLCTGPHVPNTGRVKAFKVLKNSSSYWLGKATNDSL
jgi:threonyl-tRNA synthetase